VREGYARTIVAGAVAPTEAPWVALMVLYTACRRYGVPDTRIAESGGAYPSNAFEAVCTRRPIQHDPIVSPQGESAKNWMETPCNIQRRIDDAPFSLATTPLACERVPQAFIQTYNTTAHQGLLQDQRLPPIPLEVLGAAQGRPAPPEALARQFATTLFPRTTKRYGCVTLPSDPLYGEEGVPPTQILLWVYGEQLRAVFDDVLVAESHGRDDGQTRKVHDIRDGVVSPTRFLSSQGSLIPLHARATFVVSRPTPSRQPPGPPRTTGMRPLLLFALAAAGERSPREGREKPGRRQARGEGGVWP
jgi:hypothetical protein